MNTKERRIKTAFDSAGVSTQVPAAEDDEKENCFGVVSAAVNDRDRKESLDVPNCTCERLAGGRQTDRDPLMAHRAGNAAPVMGSIPARAGVGLRSAHQTTIIETVPKIAWLEAHTEYFVAASDAQREVLDAIRRDYPLSLHGMGLSLGSADPLDTRLIDTIKIVLERFEPGFVSDHLAWSSIDGKHLHDLLPLPYTAKVLSHVTKRIARCQDLLGRQILIENVASYFEFADSDMLEWEFLANVAAAADCGILLDLNNIFVNAYNHAFDAHAYIDAVPASRVKEFHLAGHQRNRNGGREVLLDTHDRSVDREVWTLYRYAVQRIGPRPTVIEWDADLPDLDALLAEAAKAQAVLDESS